MKKLVTCLALLAPMVTVAQDYGQHYKEAVRLVEQKDYPGAYQAFRSAFAADGSKGGTYDYYTAAGTAARSRHTDTAFLWLETAKAKGLGLKAGELAYIRKDSGLIHLHADVRWQRFLDGLQAALDQKLAEERRRAGEWRQTIASNGRDAAAGHIRPGFALFQAKADSIDVPYLVYVPQNLRQTRKAPLIVFLHGGVGNTENFEDGNPDIAAFEPVFRAADSLGAVVLYPFGKKNFGWYGQEAAFRHVLAITADVMKRYRTDRERTVMAGMSNGGQALFWFASQPTTPFRGFVALAALPLLKIGDIAFARITADRPFYSLHAADDKVFPLGKVQEVYDAQTHAAPGWRLETVPRGGHSFIYGPGGPSQLTALLRRVIGEGN